MTIYRVKTSSAGSSDGSSWANACTKTYAETNATSGDSIYYGTGSYGTLAAIDGVTHYGGFDGTSEYSPALRDLQNDVTTINGGGTSGFLAATATGETVVVDGFKTASCDSTAYVNQFTFDNASVTITCRNVWFDGGDSRNTAIAGEGAGAVVNLENCLITCNTTSSDIYVGGATGATVNVKNCTISNTGTSTRCLHGEQSGVITVVNSIAWSSYSGDVFDQNGSSSITTTYSCVQGGEAGTGNISSNPNFVGSGDYSLQAGSPCIGAANSATATASDIYLRPRHSSTPTMGAFEYPLITPAAIASGATLYAPTITVGAVTVTPGAIASTSAVNAPAVTSLVSPGSIASTAALYAPTASPGPVQVIPGAIASTASVPSPTAVPGAVSVTPAAIGSTLAIFGPAAAPGAVVVQPGPIGSTLALYAPTASPGAVAITPGAIASTLQVFAPADVSSGAFIYPGAIGSGATLYALTTVPGAVTVTPAAIASSLTLYAPQVTVGTQFVSPGAIASTLAVLAPQAAVGPVTVLPGLVGATSAVLGLQVAPGGVVVQPGAIGSTGQLFGPGLLCVVSPAAIASTSQAFSVAGVQLGAALVQPGLIPTGAVLYLPTMQGGSPPTSYSVVYLRTVATPVYLSTRAVPVYFPRRP
ncbi:MAG: hypothetical protein ACWGPR_08440 [Candidatus Deferrimicrobiaceae bacterium]